jgi:hypothetical protein
MSKEINKDILGSITPPFILQILLLKVYVDSLSLVTSLLPVSKKKILANHVSMVVAENKYN